MLYEKRIAVKKAKDKESIKKKKQHKKKTDNMVGNQHTYFM